MSRRTRKRRLKPCFKIIFGIMIFMVKDWAAIGYAMIAVLSCVMLLFSGAAWGIWAVIHFIKKKKDSPPSGKM